ncbi:MAG TPA: RsmE family RNA methyltransferase [Elusimicrobiota bacterium]|nr:RsmE family RNA methyltransferase [Elusimicrobiota bacterium]
MPQFFLPPDAVSGESFVLKGPEAFHVAKVLRCRPGDSLRLFDGRGRRFEGVITEIRKDGTVSGTLQNEIGGSSPAPARARVVLCQALLKQARWDWLLEKGTELGVAAFAPLLTQRTIVPEDAARAKMERSRRVIMAAAKQCGRAELPALRGPVHLRDALKSCRDRGPVFFAWEALPGVCAASVLRPALERALREAAGGEFTAYLFIGPEGGWADEEVELAEAEGALLFGLGPATLRAETAALASVAAIDYEISALAAPAEAFAAEKSGA